MLQSKVNKRGQLGGFAMAAIGLIFLGVISAILIGAGLYATTKFQEKLDVNSIAYNATGDMITEVAGTPTWMGLLIILGFVGLIISALLGWAMFKRGSGPMG